MNRKAVMFADIEAMDFGPATCGTPAQTPSAVIVDAFGGSSPATFSGDWALQNTLDGFDRGIARTDAAGGTAIATFDPGGRTVAAQIYGSPGGPTPADRGGSSNVLLASGEARFDEAGQQYEAQKDVFLDGGTYYNGVGGSLPSGRAVTHTGGGLAANSTTNNHTDTVTLTAGGRSYVLSSTVFDRAGRATAVAADNGAITTITLDGAGRQPLVVDALGNSVQRTFDGNGNTVFITSVEKCTISGSIASESFSSAFAFDVVDRPVIRMEQGADGTLNTNWVACCTWPVLPPTLFTFLGFDSRNNRTNLVDPKQNTTIWEHDGASRQLREKRHLRAGGDGTTPIIATVLTQTAYDANSNTIWLVDSNGGTTGWLYDLLDRNTVMTFHDGSTRTNAFNAASDVIGYTDENGSHFANTPDVLGRKIEVDITAATGVLGPTFQYFQFDGLSRLALGNDIYSGTIVGFTRDSINRVLEEQQTLGGDTHYVTHNAWTSYAGTGFTFPSGRQITKAFDALYRKNGINEASDGSSIAAWQFFGGRTATVTLGNGIVTSFMNDAQTRSAIQQGQTTPAWGSISTDQLGYDGSARPIGKRHFLSGSVLAGFTTAYDPSSNKLFERALHAESRSALYANDSMDRLLQYNRGVLATGGGSITTPIALPNTDSQRAYALDALGNWPNTLFTPEGGASEIEVRTHNKLNQVTARGVAPASTPILYDHGNNTGPNAARGNGNIIDDGTLLYGLDALNQVIEVRRKSDNAVIATYLYDALRRRVYKFIQAGGLSGTIPNGESRYLLDGLQIVEELGPSGSPAIQYVWGQYIDELTQLKALTTIGPQPLAAGNYYLLSDLLYRSAALTNNTGGIAEAFDTDAYGNTIPFSAGGGTGGAWWSNSDTQAAYSACRYVFTGREFDAETGNYFYRARYYGPALGRFLSRDPERRSFTAGLYLAMSGNPAFAVDPHGLSPATVPATQPAGTFTMPASVRGRPATFTAHVTTSSGASGTLGIAYNNQDRPGSGDAGGAFLEAVFEEAADSKKPCCPNGTLQWSQTVEIKIANAAGMTAADIAEVTKQETHEHGGNDPFKGPVLDNGLRNVVTGFADLHMMEDATARGEDPASVLVRRYAPPQPSSTLPAPKRPGAVFSDSPNIPTVIPGMVHTHGGPVLGYKPGARVIKTYTLTLYCDDTPLGVSVGWVVDAVAGSDAQTTISGTITAPGVK